MRKKAFLWDFDGTLIDSEPLHVELQQLVCREAGIAVPESEWAKLKCRRDTEVFTYVIERFGNNKVPLDDLRQAKEKLYLQYARTRIRPLQGALEFLHQTRWLFPLVALVSGSKRTWVDRLCRVFDLSRYFNVVVTIDDVWNGKPDPEPYLLTCGRLCVDPSECVALEDSDNGVRSARSAGLTVFGITTSFPADVLASAGAHFIVDRYSQILPYLW